MLLHKMGYECRTPMVISFIGYCIGRYLSKALQRPTTFNFLQPFSNKEAEASILKNSVHAQF